jgi:rare lipoprotein A
MGEVMGERRAGRGTTRLALMALVGASLAACATEPLTAPGPAGGGTMRPYQVGGVWYRPAFQPHYDEKGVASWYGPQSRYHTTATGERFEEGIASAAHRTLPLPCVVEVTNLDNGRKARLRVNDRGPFVKGRILDVSRKGAQELGFWGQGTAHVRVRYIGPASARAERDLAAGRYAEADPAGR